MVKKIAALTLGRDCYSLTLDLAANVDVIENATKFIEEHKQKQNGDDELKKTNEVF